MTAATEAEGRWAYRPHLDGLRAIAVYLVVAFHAGIDRLAGGFIGVDVFFVLSGYLVTNLLVRDLDGPGDRVRFGRFYSRRARRLLPAAAVNLIVITIVFAAVAAPIELADARNAIRAAALYFANWFYIQQAADYFARDVDTSPVVHYWSLSVEEQFYVLWPLALSAVYAATRRVGRHRLNAVRGVVIGAGAASLAWALHLSSGDLNRAYFGTDARAYQLLAGAALALTPTLAHRVRRWVPATVLRPAPLVLVGVLAVLATSFVDVNPVQRGVLVAAVTTALILALDATDGGIARSLLSLAPVVYLGRISYGTYLWHWLVVVVLAHEWHVGNLATLAISASVATGLASLSYHLLELPIRSSPALDRLRPIVIATGLVVSLLVGVVIAPTILDRAEDRSTAVASAPGGGGGPSAAIPDWRQAQREIYDQRPCQRGGVQACPLRTGGKRTMVVVGDSHAGQVTPMLTALARRHDLSLYGTFLPYCPWTRGLQLRGVGKDCQSDQQKAFDDVIPRLDPDIVVLVHRSFQDVTSSLDLRDADLKVLKVGDPRRPSAIERRITAVVRQLRRDGRTVVIVEPNPITDPDHNPLTCLSKSSTVEPCRFLTTTKPWPEDLVTRRLAAADDKVVSVDLDRLECPRLPVCDPVVNGRIVMHDDNHLTTSFATSLLEPFEQILVDEGVLED